MIVAQEMAEFSPNMKMHGMAEERGYKHGNHWKLTRIFSSKIVSNLDIFASNSFCSMVFASLVPAGAASRCIDDVACFRFGWFDARKH